MTTVLLAELLTAGGTLVAAAAAVYAIYSDKLEKIQDGRLTPKGRALLFFALLGLATTVGAQVAQHFNALDSAENARRRHAQVADRLEAVTTQLQFQSLAATPLRRLTLIAYFNRDVAPSHLDNRGKVSFSVVFMRGGQSEFRLEAFPTAMLQVGGKVQLEGRVQRVSVPLEQGATYSGVFEGFKWRTHDSTSLWVDLDFQNLIPVLQASTDGEYTYWPYETVGDLRDVSLIVSVEGSSADGLQSTYIRLNEDIVLTVPPFTGGEATVGDLLPKLKRDDE